ncbi:MAG: hypothetical protein B7X11_04345 [Acidobacteria bacterium 37-65-4]|nr:MAG: hypothetical protein B7X11_04345 [Acidobacteria bacterium 37-65-4]
MKKAVHDQKLRTPIRASDGRGLATAHTAAHANQATRSQAGNPGRHFPVTARPMKKSVSPPWAALRAAMLRGAAAAKR